MFYLLCNPTADFPSNASVYLQGNVDTRTRRGMDVCFSLSDVFKGINAVTGGLMNTAKGLIDKLFHGKSPFKIPGEKTD